MGCVPIVRFEAVSVAVLVKPDPFGVREAEPITLIPSRKTTDPDGATELPVSVAVKVTGWL